MEMTFMTVNLSSEFDYIVANVQKVRDVIEQAAAKSGRKPDEIKLMAVTKTMPAQAVTAALDCGITLFGENRVQELLDKLPELDMTGRSAHIIGHMQTNKVKYVIDKVDMIQSLDSFHLAQEIDSQAEKAKKIMKVLVEVNIGREQSKSGVMPEEIFNFIDRVSEFSHLKICGLMSIPPFDEDKEKTRLYFKQIRKLFIDIAVKKSDNIDMNVLSMGMSSDFAIAIEEGSTMIRVGTSIFGKRNYLGGN
jgi:pyridoxal phosphate enzyme (YggS family)